MVAKTKKRMKRYFRIQGKCSDGYLRVKCVAGGKKADIITDGSNKEKFIAYVNDYLNTMEKTLEVDKKLTKLIHKNMTIEHDTTEGSYDVQIIEVKDE